MRWGNSRWLDSYTAQGSETRCATLQQGLRIGETCKGFSCAHMAWTSYEWLHNSMKGIYAVATYYNDMDVYCKFFNFLGVFLATMWSPRAGMQPFAPPTVPLSVEGVSLPSHDDVVLIASFTRREFNSWTRHDEWSMKWFVIFWKILPLSIYYLIAWTWWMIYWLKYYVYQHPIVSLAMTNY